MPKFDDELVTLAAGLRMGAAGDAAANAAASALDPIGAAAQADLTDAAIAAFIDGSESRG